MADVEVDAGTETAADGPAISVDEILRRSQAALADRRARGEITTYRLDGWMVREFPGQRIVRLCAEGDFRAADWPLPECRGRSSTPGRMARAKAPFGTSPMIPWMSRSIPIAYGER